MIIIKSLKYTELGGNIVSGKWKMVLHTESVEFDGMQTIYLELYDTKTGRASKHTIDKHSQLIDLMTSKQVYGFAITDAPAYRGDFLVVIDKLSLACLDYIRAVELVDIRIGENQVLDKLMKDAGFAFRHIDELGTLFVCNGQHGMFACTLLDAMKLSRNSFIGNNFYMPYSKSLISQETTMYKAFKVSFADIQMAKRQLAKAVTLT